MLEGGGPPFPRSEIRVLHLWAKCQLGRRCTSHTSRESPLPAPGGLTHFSLRVWGQAGTLSPLPRFSPRSEAP